MTQITFIQKDGSQQTVDAPKDWSIMQIAKHHAIYGIDGACGGSMACATCHVYIHPDWQEKVSTQDNEQSEEEIDILDMAFDVCDNSRLGCQVIVTEELDGLVVGLPGAEME